MGIPLLNAQEEAVLRVKLIHFLDSLVLQDVACMAPEDDLAFLTPCQRRKHHGGDHLAYEGYEEEQTYFYARWST